MILNAVGSYAPFFTHFVWSMQRFFYKSIIINIFVKVISILNIVFFVIIDFRFPYIVRLQVTKIKNKSSANYVFLYLLDCVHVYSISQFRLHFSLVSLLIWRTTHYSWNCSTMFSVWTSESSCAASADQILHYANEITFIFLF